MQSPSQALRLALRKRKIHLALMTEPERGDRARFLLSDRLVWVRAKGGDAYELRHHWVKATHVGVPR